MTERRPRSLLDKAERLEEERKRRKAKKDKADDGLDLDKIR